MAIAAKSKPKTTHHKKRAAQHHRQTKHYVKSYWPYLPIAAIITAGVIINGLIDQSSAVLGETSNLSQTALLQATNNDRLENKTASLQLNDQLEQAAQAKAADMATKNYWSHDSPTGAQPWSFVAASGYQYQAAGENLAYGFTAADKVTDAWMQSPSHRANLLSKSYSEVGFGVAQAADYLGNGPQTIVVAMYALPASAGNSIPLTTNAPEAAAPVSRVQMIAGSQLSALLVGIVGTLAVVTVLLRHGFAWRRLLNHGEMFVVTHPKFDIALVAIVVVAVLLNQTSGFIR
jgi:uncharacterized protein YkwD